MNREYDVIVVGSGAGGAAVACELTRAGKKVLLLERGGRTRIMGNTLTVALSLEKFGLTRSREKNTVVFGNNYGGLSLLSAGCAIPPQKSIFDPVGVDLCAETESARKEMWVQVLPDELAGAVNLRLLEAANDAGFHWQRVENFIDARKCRPDCGACMLGCPTGAKWNARVYADEAIAGGADLRLHTTVSSVLMENGKAVGVEGRRLGRKVSYHSKAVVLSAGTGNVSILRKAGIREAGNGFCCDWLQFVGGIIPGMRTGRSNPMTVGTMEHYEADGIAIMPVFPNWAQFAVMLGFMGGKALRRLPDFWRYTGLMVKIRDERQGAIFGGTSFSKPITRDDMAKLNKGIEIIRKILKKAGADMNRILVLKPSGAHPSATCGIGRVVDGNLQTAIANLYCCDSSVFPSSLGTPTVWTNVALGKRLGKHLSGKTG
ncbi:MAG: GMC family oxidoreductase N-terminal domain-containing protein [Thermodesulfobacteriota bacterium]